MTLSPSLRSTLCISFMSIVAVALNASPASAGLADGAANCNDHTLEQPFVPWLDDLNYVLAPDGAFERRARGWTLTGGARVVNGNERYYAHSAGDRRSLYLRPGSSAESPAMCVGIEYPTLRMFVLNRRAALSTLKVEVRAELVDSLGIPLGEVVLPIGTLTASRSWQPTLPLPILLNLAAGTSLAPTMGPDPCLPQDCRSAVKFIFTPQDSAGDWRIDDVYVDPYRRS